MTVVAALKLPNKVVIGSDSLVCQGFLKTYLPAGKLVEVRPDFIIGFSGTNTITHLINELKNKKRVTTPKTAFDCFKLLKPIFEQYKSTVENCLSYNKEENYGCELLIVTTSGIFCCDEFSCEEHSLYAAVGCGREKALGSLFSDHKKEKSLKNALKAAIFHDMGCGGEVVIKEILFN